MWHHLIWFRIIAAVSVGSFGILCFHTSAMLAGVEVELSHGLQPFLFSWRYRQIVAQVSTVSIVSLVPILMALYAYRGLQLSDDEHSPCIRQAVLRLMFVVAAPFCLIVVNETFRGSISTTSIIYAIVTVYLATLLLRWLVALERQEDRRVDFNPLEPRSRVR